MPCHSALFLVGSQIQSRYIYQDVGKLWPSPGFGGCFCEGCTFFQQQIQYYSIPLLVGPQIQSHYIYQDVGKLLSSPGLRGCFLHFPVGLLPHEVAGQKLSKKIVHSNNIIRLSGLRSQENISEN